MTILANIMVTAIVFIPEMSLLIDSIAIKHKKKILSHAFLPYSVLYRNIKINNELKLFFLWD